MRFRDLREQLGEHGDVPDSVIEDHLADRVVGVGEFGSGVEECAPAELGRGQAVGDSGADRAGCARSCTAPATCCPGWAATSSPCCWSAPTGRRRGASGRRHPRRARAAVLGRRRHRAGQRQHRDLAVPGAGRRGLDPAAPRRHRDVPGQGEPRPATTSTRRPATRCTASTGCATSRSCGPRSSAGRSSCTTSRRCTPAPSRSPASRRWCAGSTRPAACCCRTRSCRWSRTPA